MATVVVAFASNFAIGKDGALPWGHIPDDMRRVRGVTRGGVVVMGRRTYESIPPERRPLVGRTNVVLTRDSEFKEQLQPGLMCVGSFEELDCLFLHSPLRDEEWFVLGGRGVYEHFLRSGFVKRMVATHVEMPGVAGHLEGCDAFFPHECLSAEHFELASASPAMSLGPLRYTFLEYALRAQPRGWADEGEAAVLNVLRHIVENGSRDADDRLVAFGVQLRFALSGHRVPVMTTRHHEPIDMHQAVADVIRRERECDSDTRQGECDFHFVDARQRLSCHVYRRHMDCLSGIAHDVPAIAALTHIAAAERRVEAKELVLSIGEAYVRIEDVDDVRRMLGRVPLPCPLLRVVHREVIHDEFDIVDREVLDIQVAGYELAGYLDHSSVIHR